MGSWQNPGDERALSFGDGISMASVVDAHTARFPLAPIEKFTLHERMTLILRKHWEDRFVDLWRNFAIHQAVFTG